MAPPIELTRRIAPPEYVLRAWVMIAGVACSALAGACAAHPSAPNEAPSSAPAAPHPGGQSALCGPPATLTRDIATASSAPAVPTPRTDAGAASGKPVELTGRQFRLQQQLARADEVYEDPSFDVSPSQRFQVSHAFVFALCKSCPPPRGMTVRSGSPSAATRVTIVLVDKDKMLGGSPSCALRDADPRPGVARLAATWRMDNRVEFLVPVQNMVGDPGGGLDGAFRIARATDAPRRHYGERIFELSFSQHVPSAAPDEPLTPLGAQAQAPVELELCDSELLALAFEH